MATDSNTRRLPGGAVYTVSSQRSYSHHHAPPCTLLEVFVNSNASVTCPCFSCSGFTSIEDYRLDFSASLTFAISNAAVLPPNCYWDIPREVSLAVLLPANDFGGRHIVRIQVQDDESAVRDRQRKAGLFQWVFNMYMARDELKFLEGARDKAEKEWKESGDDHNCAICFEEIQSGGESLKMPCSHVFHDKCVLRWLDVNPVCPLCRFEWPAPSAES